MEFEYTRSGTLAYFAAYDVHRAHVMGQIAPKTGIAPFEDLVAQVMTTEPYATARRVFWVVDNGSSHNGQASIDRMTSAWPTATLVHLPVHASWLNQVEIYFSILQRKAISPNDFRDLDHLDNGSGLPRPVQRRRDPVRLDLHPRRPQRLHPPTRRPRRMTPDELTAMTTRSVGQ